MMAGDEQVQTAGAVALVFIGAVADFAEPVEEYGAAERILLLTLVESDVAATTQFGFLQPLERKECPFQFAEFTQRERQAVLPGIGRELAQDHRRCDRPRFNRHGEGAAVRTKSISSSATALHDVWRGKRN